MYPRTVKIKDDHLKDLIIKKGDAIEAGRKVSKEIDDMESELKAIEAKMIKLEEAVDVSALIKEGKALADQLKPILQKISDKQGEINKAKASAVPKELKDEYDAKKAWKEVLETDRNKQALRAQKFKDKIIPLGQKLAKPHLLDVYEDYDTLELKDDEIVLTVFSHLENFKAKFNK